MFAKLSNFILMFYLDESLMLRFFVFLYILQKSRQLKTVGFLFEINILYQLDLLIS
jgi:hypothetical protein